MHQEIYTRVFRAAQACKQSNTYGQEGGVLSWHHHAVRSGKPEQRGYSESPIRMSLSS